MLHLDKEPDPDPGDPVTLPLTNQFDIVADQETAIDVVFELVYF